MYIESNETKIYDILCDISQEFKTCSIGVFPASDSAVTIMDTIWDKLPPNIFTSHAKGNISHISDKEIMSKMAHNAGLFIPQTFVVDLFERIDYEVTYPIIIKPVRSVCGNKSDITVCHSRSEYRKAILDFKAKRYNQILIQQYIHNDTSKEIGITGVALPDGGIITYGYIDKIRNRLNINNYGRYIPHAVYSEIDALKTYIRSTGYIGIFDTDYILCNDKLYFIECNFRNGAYGYCVTVGGLNMPLSFFHKREIARHKLRNITFMEERTDVLNALDGSVPKGKWMWQMLSADTLLWWNWRDPMPTLAYYWDKFRKKFSHHKD